MPNTPNYNLFYPSSTDRPAAFPAAQKTSQETLDTLLKQISDLTSRANQILDDATDRDTADTLVKRNASGSASLSGLWLANDAAGSGDAVRKGQMDTAVSEAEDRAKEYTDNATRTTGIRDITALIRSEHRPTTQTGAIYLFRAADTVTVTLKDVILSGSGWATLMNLPIGFRTHVDYPDVVYTSPAGSEAVLVGAESMIVRGTGGISIRKSDGLAHRRTISFPTRDAFPSSLPGNPV